jgi:hypothetical protein
LLFWYVFYLKLRILNLNNFLKDINLKLKVLIACLFFAILQMTFLHLSIAQNNISYNESPESENLRRHVRILGSDDFMGRGTGHSGGYKAAEYLSEQFSESGLKGTNKYFQNIPFRETITQPGSVLEFITGSDTVHPELNLEYLVHKTGNGSILPKHVEMVFVGYGIVAPDYDYNDYRNINVLNKVVVMFSGEPGSDDENYFYGTLNTKHSQIDIKQRTALAQGAKACIIIPNPDEFSFERWADLIHQYSFSELSLAYTPSDIITLLILPEIAERLFSSEIYDFSKLCNMYSDNKLMSFEMKSTFSFRGVYKDRIFTAPNVLGYIEGSDSKLKNTCVIVTAHYDHLGIGQAIGGDSIYNGVLDNSMGVAALLEIARIMSKSDTKPKRSVVFLLTTAEEKGLLGSIHYLNNPIFPLYKTIANINIDGLAFIDNFNSVVGIGSNLSDLGKYLEKTATQMNLTVEEFPAEFKEIESFNRSDQVAFASVGIPAMMVMEGTDYENVQREYGLNILNEYMSIVYHSPFDDLDILINWDAAVQHTEVLLNLITNIAQSETEPKWAEWTHYFYERMKLRNEKR